MGIAQLSLFGEQQRLCEVKQTGESVTGLGRDDYAFLYTVSAHGGAGGIKFMATTVDAQKWCDSELSKGVLYGGEWAYFYTTVSNWIACHFRDTYAQGYLPTIDISGLHDNGKWDERIASTGCRKIGINEFATVLAPLGVRVKNRRGKIGAN